MYSTVFTSAFVATAMSLHCILLRSNDSLVNVLKMFNLARFLFFLPGQTNRETKSIAQLHFMRVCMHGE